MLRYGLNIHPEKSKIVFYRKNNETVLDCIETSFVFLGYCFRPRLIKSKQDVYFMGYSPAVSRESACSFREKIRTVMKETNTTDIVLLTKVLTSIIRGWMNYFLQVHIE